MGYIIVDSNNGLITEELQEELLKLTLRRVTLYNTTFKDFARAQRALRNSKLGESRTRSFGIYGVCISRLR